MYTVGENSVANRVNVFQSDNLSPSIIQRELLSNRARNLERVYVYLINSILPKSISFRFVISLIRAEFLYAQLFPQRF